MPHSVLVDYHPNSNIPTPHSEITPPSPRWRNTGLTWMTDQYSIFFVVIDVFTDIKGGIHFCLYSVLNGKNFFKAVPRIYLAAGPAISTTKSQLHQYTRYRNLNSIF
jgi:hypothetical protein